MLDVYKMHVAKAAVNDATLCTEKHYSGGKWLQSNHTHLKT